MTEQNDVQYNIKELSVLIGSAVVNDGDVCIGISIPELHRLIAEYTVMTRLTVVTDKLAVAEKHDSKIVADLNQMDVLCTTIYSTKDYRSGKVAYMHHIYTRNMGILGFGMISEKGSPGVIFSNYNHSSGITAIESESKQFIFIKNGSNVVANEFDQSIRECISTDGLSVYSVHCKSNEYTLRVSKLGDVQRVTKVVCKFDFTDNLFTGLEDIRQSSFSSNRFVCIGIPKPDRKPVVYVIDTNDSSGKPYTIRAVTAISSCVLPPFRIVGELSDTRLLLVNRRSVDDLWIMCMISGSTISLGDFNTGWVRYRGLTLSQDRRFVYFGGLGFLTTIQLPDPFLIDRMLSMD